MREKAGILSVSLSHCAALSLQTCRLCQSQAAAAEEESLFLQDEMRACRGGIGGEEREGAHDCNTTQVKMLFHFHRFIRKKSCIVEFKMKH